VYTSENKMSTPVPIQQPPSDGGASFKSYVGLEEYEMQVC